MLLPLVSLISGILLFDLVPKFWLCITLFVTGISIALTISIISRTPAVSIGLSRIHQFWITPLFCAIGMFTAFLHQPSGLHAPLDDTHICHDFLRAEVLEINSTNSGERLLVELKTHFNPQKSESDNFFNPDKVSNIKAVVYSPPINIRIGDILEFPCRFEPLTDSPARRNSGYADHMRTQGIYHSIRLSEKTLPEVKIIRGSKFNFIYVTHNIRDKVRSLIEQTPLKASSRDFLITILLGDRQYIDPAVKHTFANAGISHILALSGMHISIVAGILLCLLFPLNLIRLRKAKYLIAALVIWGYTCISGAAPSTIRAAVMTTFIFVAIILERHKSPLNALLGATFFILIFSPGAISDAGFLLSVTAVASLILFTEQLNPINRHFHHRTHALWNTFATPFIATIATMTLTAHYFGKLPLMFLPVNVITLPLLPPFITLALLYLLIFSMGIHLQFITDTIDLMVDSLEKFADIMSGSGQMVLNLSADNISVLLWWVALGCAAWYVYKRSRVSLSVTILTFIFAAVSLFRLNMQKSDEGMIMQPRSDMVALYSYEAGEETLITAPPHQASIIRCQGKTFMIADNISGNSDLRKVAENGCLQKINYLIITSGCYADADEIAKINADTVVMHGSLNKKKRERLSSELQNAGRIVTYLKAKEGIHILPLQKE